MCRDHLETGLCGGCELRPGDAGLYVGGNLGVLRGIVVSGMVGSRFVRYIVKGVD